MNEVFRALADPTRREILRRLRGREMSAGELAECFPLAKSTLSGHFNVLKAADLVRTERRKQTIVYALNATVMEEALAAMMSLLNVGDGATGDALGGTES
ncbi:MAG: winged helix-turn-helix transcriptional regulator [Candidatus Sericytochromatia bacterium]|nr:winged helix-turn-helix transcriptional regulator [Candidatus Sericytochromatia bacterium]